MLDKEPGSPSSCDGGKGGDKVSSFGDGVHYYHYCIVTRGLWQFYYEIDANGIPRCVRNRERMEFSYWEVPLGFRPEA
jgi:hypothetical protein